MRRLDVVPAVIVVVLAACTAAPPTPPATGTPVLSPAAVASPPSTTNVPTSSPVRSPFSADHGLIVERPGLLAFDVTVRSEAVVAALYKLDAGPDLRVSPDGRRIATLRNKTELRVIDASPPGTNTRIVATVRTAGDTRLAWAVDGSAVVIMDNVAPRLGSTPPPSGFYAAATAVDLATGSVTELVRIPITYGPIRLVAWDPTRKLLTAVELGQNALTHYHVWNGGGAPVSTTLDLLTVHFLGGMPTSDGSVVLHGPNGLRRYYGAAHSATMVTAPGEQLWAVEALPGSPDVLVLVGPFRGAGASPGPVDARLERWGLDGRRSVVTRLRAASGTSLGALLLRPDGTAAFVRLIGPTEQVLLVDLASGATAPVDVAPGTVPIGTLRLR